MKYTIRFLPSETVTHAPEGTTLFNAANWAGLAIDSTCGGRGTCGKCKVRLVEGQAPIREADRKYLTPTELSNGWRLSCRAVLHTDCVVDVPRLMGNPKAALLGYGHHVILNPNVAKVFLQLAEPNLEDQQSDLGRIVAALDTEGYEVHTNIALWRTLPKTLRRNDFQVTAVVVGDELIAIEPGDTRNKSYGLAVDIGTTTVVGAIVNLNTGAVEAVKSELNRQASFGADVISRVSHTMMEEEGLAVLQSRIIETLNDLLGQLTAQSGIAREEIYECVVVGNSTMLHLLMGIDPEAISVAPFIPTITAPVTFRAADIGLRLHPEARVSTLPHLGAYVGADIVAGILATDLTRNKDSKLRLLIDVGTNGEIVLGSVNGTLATAAPAGPAFEGAQIKNGMRASTGAIEGVTITPEGVSLQIIGGDVRPIGIAGSGLVDAVAEMYRMGIVDASGRMIRPEEAQGKLADALIERLVTVDGVRAFRLSDPESNIVLTQQDIRALQFAKGSIAAGVMVLMQLMGVTANDIHEVLLAGSFGSYINPASARAIGLVPWVPVERIVAVGNSAGEGAKIALLSFREREAANRIPEFIEYVELSGRSEFNDIFTDALAFPPLHDEPAISAPVMASV
ncbi:MAG TPA: ASKHA domain-containing protein [Anaerolineae bacterium]|nr:ASKHA domain-containing protein [Anaerolineae bacterium]